MPRAIPLLLLSVVASSMLLPDVAFARPNVLLILTDDQGWGDVHEHGNEKIDTPTLDRLRADSVRFERFFVSPVCAPTRAALLSGRWPARTGVTGVTGRREVMRADEVTIAEVFRDAHYRTGCFGKWHNGEQFPNDPRGQGFEEFFGFKGGHWNDYFDTTLEHDGEPVETKGYISDVLTDAALAFLTEHAREPFLCYVPYNAPHSPWQLPDRYFEKYTERGFDAPTASAYGMVENLDENIGRLLAKLDDLGLAENTIVVFLTDNGPNTDRYNGGMRGRKGSVHEGGCRVPCFVRWTGTLEPRTVENTAAHVDLLPTLADLCGIEPPTKHPLDGRSVAPLMRGDRVDWAERPILTYRPSGRGTNGAVRTQRWRFVRERGRDQLFDMSSDPGQKKDVASAHPDELARLRSTFERFDAEVAKSAATTVPIPVGHPSAPLVELPAVEARLEGNVKFANGNGWAHDWIDGWTSTDDVISWDLDVATAGRYEVVLSYGCPKSDTGSVIAVSAGNETLGTTLDRPFDAPRRERPERSKEKGPRLVRDFGTTSLGTIGLPKGPVSLRLRATNIPSDSVAEVDAIRLRAVSKD